MSVRAGWLAMTQLTFAMLQRMITGSKNRQRDTSIQQLGCGGGTFRNSIPLLLTRLSGAHVAFLASAFLLARLSPTPNRSIPDPNQPPLGRFLLSVVTRLGGDDLTGQLKRKGVLGFKPPESPSRSDQENPVFL
jgi:hypothetical protein